MRFRVCTLNAQGRQGGSAFIERRVSPELVLVQEAKAEYWPDAVMPVEATEGRSRLGATAVLSRGAPIEPLDAQPDASSEPPPAGTFTAAVVRPDQAAPFVVVSVYALIQNNVAFWTATSLVDAIQGLVQATDGRRLVVGGDFNAWDQYGGRWQPRWQGLWTRLEALGLINLLRSTRDTRVPLEWCRCGLGDGCWHVQTVRRSSRAHTDYLWASPDIAARCVVGVMDIHDEELRAVSDHSPVWADLLI